MASVRSVPPGWVRRDEDGLPATWGRPGASGGVSLDSAPGRGVPPRRGFLVWLSTASYGDLALSERCCSSPFLGNIMETEKASPRKWSWVLWDSSSGSAHVSARTVASSLWPAVAGAVSPRYNALGLARDDGTVGET